MNHRVYIERTIPVDLHQHRLDQALAGLCPEYSRSQIQHWIRDGGVQVNCRVESKPSTTVHSGQHIIIATELPPQESWQAQNIPLKIVYQDEDLIVVDKPAGLVVHPGAGNPEHTLVNALLHHDPSLITVPRAGLVHRLDKDTSGLLVIARHLSAHRSLVNSLQQREIKREYETVVHGIVTRSSGTISTRMGRHPTQRTKMSVTLTGKEAVTHFRVLQKFDAYSYLRVQLETGRTHQIRVHFAHIRHPVVGDPLYGRKLSLAEKFQFPRQALHAVQLTLAHPRTGETLSWTSPLPADIQQLLQQLQEDCSL
jgi:23S rRNA pseudouridine1911/1915/1917 synthase